MARQFVFLVIVLLVAALIDVSDCLLHGIVFHLSFLYVLLHSKVIVNYIDRIFILHMQTLVDVCDEEEDLQIGSPTNNSQR